MSDIINHPEHYKGRKLEAIQVIEDFGLGFHLGNAIKYILRAGKKGDAVLDLRKAMFYIEREIDNQAMAAVEELRGHEDEGSSCLIDDRGKEQGT